MNVVIPGTWDLFHEGHKKLIDYGHVLCGDGILNIVVNSDDLSVRKGKDPREICGVRVMKINKYLKANKIDALIHVSSRDSSSVNIALLSAPCIWLTGRDWDRETTSERNDVPVTFWEEHNIYLLYKDRVPGVSTTELKKL